MKKPNILICGPDQFTNTDLLNEATPAGAIPDNASKDVPVPGEDEAPDGKRKPLVRRVVETPVANFIEANELTSADNEWSFPRNLSLGDYVKNVESELRTGSNPSDNDAKVDVVWFYMGCDLSPIGEPEKDFIRSAACVPNALIVATPTIVLNRAAFKAEIDALTALAGSRRVVLAPSAGSGNSFIAISSGTRYLVEKTKSMYLDSVDASDEEREAYEDAWAEFYKDKLVEWQEALEDALSDCTEQAAGRANFILNKTADVSLADLVEEGIDLLGELIEILRGNTEVEDKPCKTELAHTAELKDNIELMIYEIAACYGYAATAHDVETVFRHSKASRLPKDAAAITYAVAQVAKAFYEPGTKYSSKDLLAIYREAKEEAMQMEFKPFDDENPYASIDDDFELDEEDLEDADEPDDSDMDDVDDPDSDVHEPADELPEDCRVDAGLKPSND